MPSPALRYPLEEEIDNIQPILLKGMVKEEEEVPGGGEGGEEGRGRASGPEELIEEGGVLKISHCGSTETK